MRCYQVSPGRGLPIGALTSQHFANQFLGAYDRFLLERCGVVGMARYMDDTLAVVANREAARSVRDKAIVFVRESLGLKLKEARIRPTRQGATFCGFRVLPFRLRLSRRRRRRYLAARRDAELAFARGILDARGLQAAYAAALAVTAHAEARGFRRADLAQRPAVDA